MLQAQDAKTRNDDSVCSKLDSSQETGKKTKRRVRSVLRFKVNSDGSKTFVSKKSLDVQ